MNALDRAGRLWWVWLPRFGARLSSSLGFTLLDGLWIGTLRVVNLLATPAAFGAGLWIGWQQPGFTTVPSESLTLLVVFVAVGVASAQLGFAMLCGFVTGNFFLANTTWSFTAGELARHDWWGGEIGAYLLRVRVPLLISYGVLAVVLVKLPLGMKAIVRALLPGDRAPLVVRVLIALVGEVALAAVAVYLWALAAPVLIRPVWSWVDLAPTVDAIRPLQEDAPTLARVAALAVAVRLAIQTLLVVRPLGDRAAVLEQELSRPLAKRPIYDRLPSAVRAIVTAALSTALLAGLCATWLDAAAAFAAIALAQLVRTGVVPLPIGNWSRLMDRIPVLLRFAAGIVAVFLIGEWFLPERVRTAEDFRPQLVFLLIGVAVFSVLIPSVPGSRRAARAAEVATA